MQSQIEKWIKIQLTKQKFPRSIWSHREMLTVLRGMMKKFLRNTFFSKIRMESCSGSSASSTVGNTLVSISFWNSLANRSLQWLVSNSVQSLNIQQLLIISHFLSQLSQIEIHYFSRKRVHKAPLTHFVLIQLPIASHKPEQQFGDSVFLLSSTEYESLPKLNGLENLFLSHRSVSWLNSVKVVLLWGLSFNYREKGTGVFSRFLHLHVWHLCWCGWDS